MQRHVLIVLACAISACGGTGEPSAPGGPISVRTDRSDYRPLDVVLVATTNRTGRTLYDDHCGGEVQGFEYLGRWNGSYGSARACLALDADDRRASRVAIPPGATHLDTMYVNGRAYTGTWRVALDLLDEDGAPLPEERRVSEPFRVHGDWRP
jgi:hypothetical protein